MRDFITAFVGLILLSLVLAGWTAYQGSTVQPGEGVFCTADAKLCPDGSAVGRVPPDCAFAQCPGE